MSDKIRKIKQAYAEEVSLIKNEALSRSLLLEHVKAEITSSLSDKIHEMSKEQLSATQKLIALIDQKTKAISAVSGSLNEKEKFKALVKEIDVFFCAYPFIGQMFDKLLRTESSAFDKQKMAVQSYLQNLSSKDEHGIERTQQSDYSR